MLIRLPLPLLAIMLLTAAPATAAADLTPVDDTDDAALEASASRAFFSYLRAIDDQHLDDANDHALDPGNPERRINLIDRLLAFIHARAKNPVRNEALVLRCVGDWALCVYQYDITVAGKTARVITTAWMVQWEGYWRQFIVAPADEAFWDNRRSDYERLKKWFDDHAKHLPGKATAGEPAAAAPDAG